MKTKKLMAAVAVALTLCVTIGGTLAWLTDTTDEVENTFTVGNIDIELTESENLDLKMIPGNTIYKDPKVTVNANSEACWLFVEVNESDNLPDYITYEVDTTVGQWIELTVDKDGNPITGVYYREVVASGADQAFYVLKNCQVEVKDSVEGIEGDAPTLSFTAYAIQKDNITTAADAWAKVK